MDTEWIQNGLVFFESLKVSVEVGLKARSDALASKSNIVRLRILNDIFENWICSVVAYQSL